MATGGTARDQAPTIVYGVWEMPRYMHEARAVESVWTDEHDATERARNRSYSVHGQVRVVSWSMNAVDGRRLVRTFVDGEAV